ncbi:hypothetical protein ES703_47290 [subsurface metagenome]
MIRLNIGIIGLGFILILPATNVNAEKTIRLDYVNTLKLSAVQKINPEKQLHLKIDDPIKQTWLGLDTILIGKLRRHEDGKLDSILGMSVGVGIAYRHYFETTGEFGGLQPYWELGTMILLWPYGMLGVTYPIPLASKKERLNNLFCIDFSVGLLFPFPIAGIGLAIAF